ncbi:hypothetical protein [Microbacterium sp. TNHR37B]|uniref:hypothetical protein n=1 Tax=Microbacterium sp. TNHR37B TaxID=1775956 RepID=UPI0007B2A375|nr:hypothetical protein [Microbacterium sp. TNHR37B]KZE88584.1 hypothetical protein AVP41_03090 [Microbacterium sp. TNHR37B]
MTTMHARRLERRSRAASRRRPEADGSLLRWPGAARPFALFAEVLWVGALVFVVALPVVTWPAAVAAGATHVRRFLYAEATAPSTFFRDAVRALPGALLPGVGTAILGVVVAIDLALLTDGVLPGGGLVASVIGAAGIAAFVVTVLAASLWSPGAAWRDVWRVLPRVARSDLSGTLSIAVALGLAAVITWQFLPLVIPALGMVVFAAVALGERRLVRWTAAADESVD